MILLMVGTVFGCASSSPPSPIVHIPPGEPIFTETHPHKTDSKKLTDIRRIVVGHAIQSIGTPYAWGGNTPSTGFDCSGLVGYTHAQAGIVTPRTARAMFKKGRPIPRPALTPGDLVFLIPRIKRQDFMWAFT